MAKLNLYLKSAALVFMIILSQWLKSDAQEFFYYYDNNKIPLELSKNLIVVKFTEGTTHAQKKQLISSYDLMKPLADEMILPAPDVSLQEIKQDVSNDEFMNLLEQLERNETVEYVNPFYLYAADSTLQGITNQFVVKLNNSSDLVMLKKLCDETKTKIISKDAYTEGIYFIGVTKLSTGNALELANLFYESGYFEFSEPDFLRLLKPLGTVNDNLFNYQWALKNTGSSIQYNGTVEADMDVDDAWDINTGSSSIRVAIIDEGVDLTHPDLTANLVSGFDGTGLGSAGGPSGNDAHGTNCAGIVAASGNNSIGVAGIAYKCKIVPVRIAYGSGGGWVTTNSWIAGCINWSWDTGRADVLSNSWGGGGSSSLINTSITNAQTYGRNGLGSVVLFSAGNSNNAVIYPASLSNVIAVAAMSMCYQRKSPTSCDNETFWGSCYGTNLDVGAPGVKIASTDIAGSAGYRSGDYNLTFNGTSSACPNAAGVVALMLSENPNLTHAKAREILEKTCKKVGGYTYSTVTGHSNGTWCNDLGYGMVNAFEAVKEAMIYSDIPYSTGFESTIDKYWEFENSNSFGRIQIATANSPHSGSYHLLMDVNTDNQVDTNKAKLKLNLAGKHNVKLSFWWKNINDEYDTKDGVYFSTNNGQSYIKIYNLNSTSGSYQQVLLDLSKLADSFGLTLSDKSIIKFQHLDDSSLTNDGFAFDDIFVSGYSSDLTIKNTSATPSDVARDSSTTVKCDLINLGSWPADSSVIAFYLSADTVFDAGDVLLSTNQVGIVQKKDTLGISKSLHIPLNTSPGKAFIIFIADANNEIADSLETNNKGCKQINVISYPPVITADPVSQEIIIGDILNLSVTSVGAATLNYQWQKNGTQISGATAQNFSKTNIGNNDSGYYRCIVSNTYGFDTSNYAYIRVVNALKLCTTTTSAGDSGTFFDQGGASSNYDDELSCGLLINPVCADSIKLKFKSFDLELNYDYLKVYDGKNRFGTLLLSATGNTIPSEVVATSGSMYILFTSDAYVTAEGFEASWHTVKTSLHANFSINDSSQCFRGNNIALTNSSTINSGTYSNYWKFGDNTTSMSTSPTKNYSNPGNYSVKLITTSNKDCKDSISKNVYVRPHPASAFAVNDTSQCLRSNSFTFTNNSTISAGTFSNLWKFGDNTTSTSVSPTTSYASPGNFNAYLVSTSGFGCKDSISKLIYVRPHPVTSFSINDSSQCDRVNSFTYTNSSNISSGTFSNFWTFGDNSNSSSTSPTKSYSNYGNYVVKLVTTSDFNCRDSISKNAYVRPHPATAFTINDTSQCKRGNNFSFSNSTSIGSGTYSNLWKFGDNNTSTAASPSKSYTATGNYVVKLVCTSIFNCMDSISKNVYVRPHPVNSFTINDTAQCLSGNNFVLTNNSSISSGSYSNNWTFGDNTSSVVASPAKSYVSAGNYVIRLVTTSGYNCKDSFSRTVAVRGHPNIGFSINDSSQCLRGNNFLITNNSGAPNGINVRWDFGDTTYSTFIQAPAKTYKSTGLKVIKMVATEDNTLACSDSMTKNVYVWVHPLTLFGVNDSSQCLRGNLMNFTNTSSITGGSFSNAWNFGDNTFSQLSSPSKSYSNPGTFIVKLTTTSDQGCMDSLSKSMIIYPHAVSNFSVNDPVQCEQGNSFVFTNQSAISSGSYTNVWLFGDTKSSILSDPAHQYTGYNYDTFAVKLITSSDFGCKDSIEKNVSLLPTPNAEFSINDDKQCLDGNAFSFNNTTTYWLGSGTALWEMGDGFISGNYFFSYSYKIADTFTVRLNIISDLGCPDSVEQTVIVFPQPEAGFIINDSAQCLRNNLFLLTDDSKITGDSIISYYWHFGDGTTDTIKNTSYAFGSESNYSIQHKVTSSLGCIEIITKDVYVYPMPQAKFTINNADQCFKGNIFNFSNATTISSGNMNYVWFMGDGYSSADTNPAYSYLNSGNYSVKLIAASEYSCKDSLSKAVIVRETPVVYLGNDTTLYDNQKLLLDAGSGFDTYFWSNNQTTQTIQVDTTGIGLNTKLFWVRVLLDRCPGTDSINVSFVKYISIKDEASNIDIRVYPNPATDILKIETGPLNKELTILLTDLNGKIIRTMHQKPSTGSNSLQTDISGLAKGMYYLTFTNNEVRKTVKIVKN
jgi:PKD repeat protein